MRTLVQDVRYGVRQLFRQRGSSLVAVLTLALGIGVSSALFSVIDATMLRPLPFPNPEELVTVQGMELQPDGSAESYTPSMQDMRTWQAADDVFSMVAGWGRAFRGHVVDGPQPERLEVMHFTEHYLSMHGVAPILGRDFVRADCDPGSPLVALLGYGYWQRQYGGREDVLGTTIRFDDDVATIVGVLPPWFNASTPLATPLRVAVKEFASRGRGTPTVLGRLRQGISIEEAQTRLTARTPNAGAVGSLREVQVTSRLDAAISEYRRTIVVFISAVALIVLMAAVNVAGLLLARGALRQAELDVRASLGASRGRLIRQLLTESLVLAVPGGIVGVLFAWLALDSIVANIPLDLPDNSPVGLNLTVLAATAALLLVTTIGFALLPAVRLSRAQAGRTLMRSSRQAGSAFSRRAGQTLIGAEVALAVVLVSGAGLMLRSFWRLAAVDLGFNPDALVTMQVLPLDKSPAAHKAYYAALVQQLRTVPGIVGVSLVDNFALGAGTSYTTTSSTTGRSFSAVFAVMPGYLETIGARLRDGRFLSESDYSAGFAGVVINESAAHALFPGERAVGHDLTRTGSRQRWSVLGVIADLRHGGPLRERGAGEPQVYFPYEPRQSTLAWPMTVVVRRLDRGPGVVEEMRRVAASIGPRVLVEQISSSDALFTESVITPRRRTVLLGLLGALGLTLALVGVFATTAYAVARRTAEIGLRLAIGARPGQVVRTIVRDASAPIVIGTAFGVGAAVMGGRVIESFLFRTSPTDPLTLAGVAGVLVVAGSLAALVPALRAAGIDPASTLRAE